MGPAAWWALFLHEEHVQFGCFRYWGKVSQRIICSVLFAVEDTKIDAYEVYFGKIVVIDLRLDLPFK